jgi:hypothetical protein
VKYLQVFLSHQDGHHNAVALLLKAALIQVSDYRLLGASGLDCRSIRYVVQNNNNKNNNNNNNKKRSKNNKSPKICLGDLIIYLDYISN